MKTLFLLRHAKSSWDDPSLRDFDRPLAKRGKRDVPRVSKAFIKRGPIPDFIISSPAARARQTVEAFVKSAGLDVRPQFDESIYGASSAELMKLIRRMPDAASCVMLVGHNPGIEDLVARLVGSYNRMPTAALACIEFAVDSWKEVEYGEGKLLWLLRPKELDQ
jgi:phosphohistidine phosphatase